MKNDLVLLALAAMAFLQISEACSCLRSHPQTQFCTSDFVILARIKRERVFNNLVVYKVRIRQPYKLPEKAEVALKSGRLLTAADESMCGVRLKTGKLYAISGSVNSLKAYINFCGMAIEWKDLTRRQRKGLKMIYKNGCSCRIDYCAKGRSCVKSPDSCTWTSKCHMEEGVCLLQKNKKCMWTRNRYLTQCLKKDPLTISRWSG